MVSLKQVEVKNFLPNKTSTGAVENHLTFPQIWEPQWYLSERNENWQGEKDRWGGGVEAQGTHAPLGQNFFISCSFQEQLAK